MTVALLLTLLAWPLVGNALHYHSGGLGAVMDTRGIVWHATPTGYVVNGQAVDSVVSVRDGRLCQHVFDRRPQYRQLRLYLVRYQLCPVQYVDGSCRVWGPVQTGAVVDCADWHDWPEQDKKHDILELAAREAHRAGIEAYTDGGRGRILARRWAVYPAGP